MKTIKNLFCGAVLGLVLGAAAFNAKAENVVIGGYPVYTGAFIQAGPVPTYLSTNAAPLTRVANPITSTNQPYTTLPMQGFLTVNVVVTNSSCYLSNYNTTEAIFMGNALNNSSATTNFCNAIMRTGPNDTVILVATNGVNFGTGVVSSSWRN